jgi:hypothetical protein
MAEVVTGAGREDEGLAAGGGGEAEVDRERDGR